MTYTGPASILMNVDQASTVGRAIPLDVHVWVSEPDDAGPGSWGGTFTIDKGFEEHINAVFLGDGDHRLQLGDGRVGRFSITEFANPGPLRGKFRGLGDPPA